MADATANISNASGTLGDLLRDDRPMLKDTIAKLETIEQPLADANGQAQLEDLLTRLPAALEADRSCGRYLRRLLQLLSVHIASLKLNGLQPGGPVRTVRSLSSRRVGARRNENF